jgi:uncharacterized protein YegL
MDESGSIRVENYKTMLRSIHDLLRNFKIGPDDMRLAMIKFSSYSTRVFNFRDYGTFSEISYAVMRMEETYSGGGTNTAAGLRLAMSTAASYNRPNAASVAIVLTDGRSNNEKETIKEAQHFHNTPTKVFSVGIGSNVNIDELKVIASDPDSEFLVTTSFTDLYSKLQNFKNQLCRGKFNIDCSKLVDELCS